MNADFSLPGEASLLKDFDRQSGSWMERALFNNRLIIVAFQGPTIRAWVRS